jgi:uncharacterized circularly permuted ATP-grasp superfamily protein
MFERYNLNGIFDEMFAGQDRPREHYAAVYSRLKTLDPASLTRRRRMADIAFRNQGITFTVYSDKTGVERIFPFDFVPRIIPASEWSYLTRGLIQRITALNLFCKDIYHEQRILRERVIDPALIYGAQMFRREMLGVRVPRDVYIHICGSDLIRDKSGNYFVLEDNGRTPSGVSYVLENRAVMRRVFPQLFNEYRVRPVENYPLDLLQTLEYCAPSHGENPAAPRHPSRLMRYRFLFPPLRTASGSARGRCRRCGQSCVGKRQPWQNPFGVSARWSRRAAGTRKQRL